MANSGVNNRANQGKTEKSLNEEADILLFIEKKLKPLDDALEKIRLDNKSREKELDEYKTKIIEILGIFVALFTFVSVDIQIFKTELSIFSALGVTLVMLGSLLLFIIVMVFLLNGTKKNSLHKGITSIACLSIISGILLASVGYNITKDDFYEKFYTKQQTLEEVNKVASSSLEIKNDLENIRKCVKAGGWNRCY